MLKIRRPLGRLIFNMGIAIPGKTVFLIETAPRPSVTNIITSFDFSVPWIIWHNKDIESWPLNQLCSWEVRRPATHWLLCFWQLVFLHQPWYPCIPLHPPHISPLSSLLHLPGDDQTDPSGAICMSTWQAIHCRGLNIGSYGELMEQPISHTQCQPGSKWKLRT